VFLITQGITKDAWDEWVEQREGQVELVRHRGWTAAAPYSNDVTSLLYGFVDLAHYGQWIMLPGHGAGWVPHVAGGWSPYTFGRWRWYPTYGYTWISSEPWGWLPYHYGQWIFRPGIGWCWLPTNLTSWSPALVTWYRGPGWVGWSPQGSSRLRGGAADCSQPHGCGVTVSEDTFRNGRPVNPGRLRGINPAAEGRLIGRPDIEPDRLARLPGGEPSRRAGTTPELTQTPLQVGGVSGAGRISGRTPQATPVGSSPVGRQLSSSPRGGSTVRTGSGTSGIVFDPEQRRFVNAPVALPSSDAAQQSAPTSADVNSPATPPTSRVVPGEARGTRPVESLVDAHRPGPRGNYPSPSVTSPFARGTQGTRSIQGRSSAPSSSVRAAQGTSSSSGKSPSSNISSGRNSGSSAGGQSSVGSSRSSGGVSSGGSRVSVGSRSGSVGTRSSSGGRSSAGRSGGSRSSSGGRPRR
jgi:hypothetical protein